VGLLGLLALGDSPASAQDPDYHLVTESELKEAMAQVNGFDPIPTTNGARFQSEVVFALLKKAEEAGRPDMPLLIPAGYWYRAFLAKTNLSEDRAPKYVKLANQYQQHKWIDPRPEMVIDEIKKGEPPQRAINVMIWWTKEKGKKDKYSYRDTLSTPNLKVTDHRVITYRLVDFGDRYYFDKIKGLSGRPTTGLLGLLFKVIGEGRVVRSGMAVSEDGFMVLRGRAKKGFMGVSSTATIAPDGKSKKDVPEDRPDLKALEDMLKLEFEIKYKKFEWSEKMDRLIHDLELTKSRDIS
jgi:hypothetical protein